MKKLFVSWLLFVCFTSHAVNNVLSSSSSRYHHLQQQQQHQHQYQPQSQLQSPPANQHHLYSHVHVAAASQQVPQVMGYHYPVPTIQLTAASVNRPLVKPGPTAASMATTTTTTTTTIASANTSLPPTTVVAHAHTHAAKMQLAGLDTSKVPMTLHMPTVASSSQMQSPHTSNLPQVTVTLQAMSDSAATSNQNAHAKPTVAAGPGAVPVSVSMKGSSSSGSVGAGMDESVGATDVTALADEFHPLRTPMIEGIDVACGKERMTVRITFDQEFNGIVYAKGHYADPSCRFVMPNSGHKMYQFDLTTGECGVSFVDAGLNNGGEAHVEGLLVIIAEPGVQELWDAARKIRCLWEGNLEQTVSFPLSVNILDQKTLIFSGDTASVALEIQSGRGPRAQTVQGLVRIGEMLTAVVTVQGDTAFDLLVRNCVATDGTPGNRIVLSDNHGCAVKPKLMGGWLKQKTSTTVLAYAYLSAFKFPDVMDLFLECTVSLCKGECEECPDHAELYVPVLEQELRMAGTSTTAGPATAEPPESAAAESRLSKATSKRSSVKRNSINIKHRARRAAHFNHTAPVAEESQPLRLRRVVHVVGPDDMPGFEGTGSAAVYGNCHTDCFSLMGVLLAVAVTTLLTMVTLAIYGTFRRQRQMDKC